MIDTILVTTDGSDQARKAVDLAGDLKGLAMGSVSHEVASLAPCTCVAVT